MNLDERGKIIMLSVEEPIRSARGQELQRVMTQASTDSEIKNVKKVVSNILELRVRRFFKGIYQLFVAESHPVCKYNCFGLKSAKPCIPRERRMIVPS